MARIAFAVAIFPFQPSSAADLPLEIGDELYIIEEGGAEGSWYRGYLVAPPSLLTGLTIRKGQILEARVFSGVFPKCCVEVREMLGDTGLGGDVQTARFERENNADSVNGDTRPDYSPLSYVGSLRRVISRNGSEGMLESISGGGSPQDPWFRNAPSPSPSYRRVKKQHDQGLARSLSHRSVISHKSRQPSIEPLSITSSPRDLDGKRPAAPVPMLKIGDETPTSSTEPLVDEIASCLREWHSKNLHGLLLTRRYTVLDKTAQLINQLDLARRQLFHGVLTDQERDRVREKTVWNLVAGNKMLCNEIIVRDPQQRGRLLTYGDSIVEISSLQSTMSLLDETPTPQADSLNLFHVLIDLKNCVTKGLDTPTVTLCLFRRYQSETIKPLTESFSLDLPSQDQFDKLASSGRFCSLFTDLTSADVGEKTGSDVDIYLMIRIYAKRLIDETAPGSGARENREDNYQSLKRPQSSSPGPSPGKGGRQSLMWAQKQFGSTYRSRSRQDSKLSRTGSNANSATPSASRSRPSTRDGVRPSTQRGPQHVTRTVGVGLINVKNFISQGMAVEQDIPIWMLTRSGSGATTETPGQHDLIRQLVADRNWDLVKAKDVDHVRIGVNTFLSPDAEGLVVQTPTILQNVSQTTRIGFPGAPKKPRSEIYLTLASVTLPNQAYLSHADRGIVPIPAGLDLRNLQLTVEVRKSSVDRV